MTDDNLIQFPGDNSRELIAKALSITDREPGECPSMEELAALAEGKVDEAEEDRLMKHVSACETCCETYKLGAQLHRPAAGASTRTVFTKRPLALAAGFLVGVVSMLLVYQLFIAPVTPGPEPSILRLDKNLGAFLRDSKESTITDAQTLEQLTQLLRDNGYGVSGKEIEQCSIQWGGASSKSLYKLPEKVEVKLIDGRLHIKILK